MTRLLGVWPNVLFLEGILLSMGVFPRLFLTSCVGWFVCKCLSFYLSGWGVAAMTRSVTNTLAGKNISSCCCTQWRKLPVALSKEGGSQQITVSLGPETLVLQGCFLHLGKDFLNSLFWSSEFSRKTIFVQIELNYFFFQVTWRHSGHLVLGCGFVSVRTIQRKH